MKDLVILGTGGFAKEVHQIVEDINQEKPCWNFLGFLDTNQLIHGKNIHKYPILGGLDWLAKYPETHIVLGVGNPVIKYKFIKLLTQIEQVKYSTLIHPRAWIGNRVKIENGTIICAGASITTDIKIGRNVVINLNSTIGHDSIISDLVTIAPGANISGNVVIGQGCDIGTNCSVIQGVTIGHWSIVGASAVVVKNVEPNVTAVGMPAKPIKERAELWHEIA